MVLLVDGEEGLTESSYWLLPSLDNQGPRVHILQLSFKAILRVEGVQTALGKGAWKKKVKKTNKC